MKRKLPTNKSKPYNQLKKAIIFIKNIVAPIKIFAKPISQFKLFKNIVVPIYILIKNNNVIYLLTNSYLVLDKIGTTIFATKVSSKIYKLILVICHSNLTMTTIFTSLIEKILTPILNLSQ